MMSNQGRLTRKKALRRTLFTLTLGILSSLGFACQSGNRGALPVSSSLQSISSAQSDAGSGQSSSAPIGSDPQAPPSQGPVPALSPAPSSQSSVKVGESCTGDSSRTCLAVHFVSYTNSSGTATASEAQAATIIQTMNQIFAQCAIGFQIENYEAVNPAQFSLDYGANSQNQLNQIRRTFDLPSNQLLAVTTGPWGTAVNAWTNMPGEGLYGAIMEASIVSYGKGIIYAHEFGHYLGLDHVSNSANLMNPVIYTNSTQLSTSQCQLAQSTLHAYWADMIRR